MCAAKSATLTIPVDAAGTFRAISLASDWVAVIGAISAAPVRECRPSFFNFASISSVTLTTLQAVHQAMRRAELICGIADGCGCGHWRRQLPQPARATASVQPEEAVAVGVAQHYG